MSGALDPAALKQPSGGLGPRAVSAVVMAVPVLLAVYFGPPFFTLLILLAAAIMAWEWARMCRHQMHWLIFGVVYIAVPSGALVWLRGEDAAGMVTIFWLFAVVWTADIGAYASGRAIGGPKLAPSVSPKKTWAGLIGGVGLASLVATIAAFLWEGNPFVLAAWGAVVALASQMGDLFESGIKRHFGVKDTSNLIPGHGGVLDRVDALIIGAIGLTVLKLTLGKSALPWL